MKRVSSMLVTLMEEIKNAFKILFGKHWWEETTWGTKP
jgi:hypothetical protein